MYRLESVLFLCTVPISDAQNEILFNPASRSASRVFVLFAPLPRNVTVLKAGTIPVDTSNRSSFPYDCDRHEIFGLHPP